MPIELITPLGIAPEADPTFDALRVSNRPAEAAGAFRVAGVSGLTTGIAANGALFLFRNPDATKKVILQYLKVRAVVITGFTAAQELAFDALVYRNWQVDAGGTLLSVASNNMKKRASLAPSIANVRVPAAAAITTPAAPAVADGNPFMAGMCKTLAAAATVQDAVMEEVFDATNGSDFPFVFEQNEGFAIRNSILMGAAGTVRWSMTAAWLENPTY